MSHYDIHVGDVIKYPEMVMARTGYLCHEGQIIYSFPRVEQLSHACEMTSQKYRNFMMQSINFVEFVFFIYEELS